MRNYVAWISQRPSFLNVSEKRRARAFVGYRASLTEVVQIIGRATRDAPGKTRARFTNLIAEPDASEEVVATYVLYNAVSRHF